ncbi:lysis protein [Pantoea sp. 1.19]|uniref:lysis protein n=1 Tax=Pantoea sp. 1.19 TaxID=1925589 RepID=UPI0009489CDF|nr:lysis protein [Pantoea sp. 1.19]
MSITSRLVAVTVILLMLCAVGATLAALHYRSNAIQYQGQRDTAQNSLAEATATITDMQTRQRDVAALDAKYTGEIADAKATIEKLRDDVSAGNRRVYIKASCPASSGEETSPGRVGHATTARPDDGVEQHYWRLREQIGVVTKQVSYLQQYIREQCLN